MRGLATYMGFIWCRFGVAVGVCVALSIAFLPAVRADTGMLTWDDAEIAQALDAFVPRLMEHNSVPGAQVALMRGGRLIYERGFGIRNVIGRAPVTPDTLFEAASLSKPVAAHVAMQLVAAGKLRLDTDIGLGLEPPWLEPGSDGRVPSITLRQILTHTSGLSNDLRRSSHALVTTPGEAFAYAGEGFDYLGYAITAHEQKPFADVARARLFEPLGIQETGFALRDDQMSMMATGHTAAWMPVALVALPFIGMFAASLALVFVVVRLVLQQPRLRMGHLTLPLLAGGIASMVVVLELAGLGLATTVFIIAFVFALVVALAVTLWRLLFHVLGFSTVRPGTVMRQDDQRSGFWMRLALVLGVLCAVPLLFANVPIPLRAAGDVHPASSLRGTAGEIALFAREMMSPTLLEPSDMATMTTPQVHVGKGVSKSISWGLGIGIRDRVLSDGDTQRTLWQWGINPGYASLLIVEPREQVALVVLTNAQSGGAMVQELGAHVFGGLGEPANWTLPGEAFAPSF